MRNLILILSFVVSGAGYLGGCAKEVSHHETDRPGLLGGRVHEEQTTYRNPDGSYTTEKERVKTNP